MTKGNYLLTNTKGWLFKIMGKGPNRRKEDFAKVQKHWDEITWSSKKKKNITNPMTVKHKASPFDSKNYNFSMSGKQAKIKSGSTEYLNTLGWCKGVTRNYDLQIGTIKFEYGMDTNFHHFCVAFSDGVEVGFPPESIDILQEID